MNTILNVSTTVPFLDPPIQSHSPFADVIYEWFLSKQCAAVASRDHAMIDGCKDKTLAHKLQH